MLVRLDAEPGTSNPRMTETRDRRSPASCGRCPGVDNVGAHVGRAVTGDQIVDVNSSEVWVSIDSGADYDETVDDIRDAVAGARRVERDVVTYSTQKIRDVGALEAGRAPSRGDGRLDVLTGVDEPLVVRVYGQDLDVLRAEAAQGPAADRRRRRRRRSARRAAAGAADARDRGRPRARAAARASSPATCAARRRRCCRASRSAASSRTRRCSTCIVQGRAGDARERRRACATC